MANQNALAETLGHTHRREQFNAKYEKTVKKPGYFAEIIPGYTAEADSEVLTRTLVYPSSES
jgi:hypothetical protein